MVLPPFPGLIALRAHQHHQRHQEVGGHQDPEGSFGGNGGKCWSGRDKTFVKKCLVVFFCATWRSWRRWQTLGEAGNWKITNQWLKVGSLNVPIEHHPTIRYMVYNGYYKVMSNIPKMGQLPTPVESWVKMLKLSQLFSAKAVRLDKILCLFPADGPPGPPLPRIESPMTMKIKPPNLRKISLIIPKGLKKLSFF